MRRLLVLLLAAASLGVAGATADQARPATTDSQTVKITATGYMPTSVSITVGDAVVFTNSDTVAHTVQFNTAAGMHCSVAVPLVLQPGKSGSCTFSSAGKFNFSDPANKNKSFRGTVSVAKVPAVSLTITPKSAIYGRMATLAGTLESHQAGQSLQILAQQCGVSATAQPVTATTASGGAYSYQTKPLKLTTYTVKYKTSSSTKTLKVHPRLRLGKVAPHRYTVRVFAAQSFAGKYVIFQRYRLALRRWVNVKQVLLRANGTGIAPTVISSARFHSRIRTGVLVRVLLGRAQTGSCYLGARSNTIRS